MTDTNGQAMLGMSQVHRAEIAELTWQIMQLRALLEEHGIEPPDFGAAGLAQWRDAAKVIRAAFALVEASNDFYAKLGTSQEMMAKGWRD